MSMANTFWARLAVSGLAIGVAGCANGAPTVLLAPTDPANSLRAVQATDNALSPDVLKSVLPERIPESEVNRLVKIDQSLIRDQADSSGERSIQQRGARGGGSWGGRGGGSWGGRGGWAGRGWRGGYRGYGWRGWGSYGYYPYLGYGYYPYASYYYPYAGYYYPYYLYGGYYYPNYYAYAGAYYYPALFPYSGYYYPSMYTWY